jgi:hypothetical protein
MGVRSPMVGTEAMSWYDQLVGQAFEFELRGWSALIGRFAKENPAS